MKTIFNLIIFTVAAIMGATVNAQSELAQSNEGILIEVTKSNKESFTELLASLIKDSNGDLIMTSYSEATKICRNLGKRLPTAREMAELSTQQGAEIKNTLIGNEAGSSDFQLREFTVLDGSVDSFYYSKSSYASSIGIDTWVWTSSDFGRPSESPIFKAVFHIKSGSIPGTEPTNEQIAVMCVDNIPKN